MRSSSSTVAERSIDAVRDGAQRATREASPWIEGLGRFGYVAKGVVYLVIGVLAVQAALGHGGGTTDQQGALTRVIAAPFGQILLLLLTIGLLGCAVWRFVQAAKDTEGKGSEPKGLLARAGYAGVGVLYFGLAFSALRLLLGSGGGGGQQQAQDWTARLLGQPMGAWLVALAGAAVIANGLFQLYRAYSTKFREKLRTDKMHPEQVDRVTKLGRAGYAARGVSFGLIGLFLIQAARHREPGEVRGLDGSLAALAEQPYGPEMMALVAAGLAAYGVFALVEARYRRMILR